MLESCFSSLTFAIGYQMKLFLINTPLQAVIVARIIELEKIELHGCSLIYVCDDINAKHLHSYSKIASLFKFSTFISNARSISGIKDLRAFIRNLGCVDCIYLACIDDSIAHYAISFTNGAKLKTFDDGTANISPNSSYFNDRKKGNFRSFALKIFHRLNGNTYDMQKVKDDSLVHYSIYSKYENVMNNVEHIELFEKDQTKKDTCHLFNGVNYVDYCNSNSDAKLLKKKIGDFLKTIEGDVIYISENEKDEYIFGDFIVRNELIDVEYLESLRKRYKVINIYGFADYLQNLFLDEPGIVIRPINSDLLLAEVNECSSVLSSRCKIDAICL